MKDLLTYIAQNLVEHPQAVDVQETETDGNVVLELRVDPSDMGKVIGRQGRIAKEIRTLMRSVAQRQGKKVSVEIPLQWTEQALGSLHLVETIGSCDNTERHPLFLPLVWSPASPGTPNQGRSSDGL